MALTPNPPAVAPSAARYRPWQVDVLVPGRADGLVIKRVHFRDAGDAQTYQDDVAAQNLYVTDISFCKDEACVDHDITRD